MGKKNKKKSQPAIESTHDRARREARVRILSSQPIEKPTTGTEQNHNQKHVEHDGSIPVTEEVQILAFSPARSAETDIPYQKNEDIDYYPGILRKESDYTGSVMKHIPEVEEPKHPILYEIEQDVARGVLAKTKEFNKKYHDNLYNNMVDGIITPEQVTQAVSKGVRQWRRELFPQQISRGGKEQ
jgi:hypothetical protein